MKAFFAQHGIEVYVADYAKGQPTCEELEVYTEEVKRYIKEIKPVAIIAHSMGGIIARYVIETNPQLEIQKLIILESPNQGIPSWSLPIAKLLGIPPDWPSTKSMVRGSRFFQQLRHKVAKTRYYNIGGIYSLIFPSIFNLPDVPMKIFITRHSVLRKDFRVLRYVLQILQS